MGIVAERLQLARNNKRLSQMDVMRLTNINNKSLSGYENSVSEPDAGTLVVLANLYGVTTDYLLGRVDEPNGKVEPKREDDVSANGVAYRRLKTLLQDGHLATDEEWDIIAAVLRSLPPRQPKKQE